jgi:glycosyltransferase involved in cell wall biosynthesis
MWFHPHMQHVPGIVAHCGTDFTPASPLAVAALRRDLGLSRPYFMLSGNRMGYKNALLVFRALLHLGGLGREYSILCCGGSNTLEPELAALAIATHVLVADLDDVELQAAYTGATALLYPSLYEGFGLPPLEAMACGTPVITSPAPAIAEVCGDAVIYVAPRNTAGLAQEMARLVRDDGARAVLARRGADRAARFTWNLMADRVSGFLRRLSAAGGKEGLTGSRSEHPIG